MSKALERLRRSTTVGNLWMYIIKVLLDSGPLKAYDIRKKLVEIYGLKPATVTVYSVIYRMTREGLLKKTNEPETRYEVTSRGVKCLEKAVELLKELVEKLSH
ncbi:MAG: PadR family transcriptional regulator [Desulfurococcaceae archaeon]|nr:helix-turn-helix transcriptional regulator [Sulfolobales archaeon]MDW8170016.1 PadR family transcriptional regulator [Desulfurococcaceae archaeon]